ncbi:MAG: TIGR02147 family protein [Bacteriovoracaceae bacterium]|jgi:uncharacterized protein (TIGR02147 family)|nr:TIGR02147 family protein [Bacteriovoracaceae bacterium]
MSVKLKPVLEYISLQDYLRDILVYRTQKNSSYSMRALAKSLNIDQSTLSRFMSENSKGSTKLVEKIANKLLLTPEQTNYFLEQHCRQNQTPLQEFEQYHKITADSYEVLSKWYYMPILQLIRIKDFKPDTLWISEKLGLDHNETIEAINRLQRLNLLEIKDDKWIDRSSGQITSMSEEQTSNALKRLQSNLRKKAIDALYNIDITDRDHTAMVIPCKKSDLPQVKERITEFRRGLAKFLERHEDKDSLYQLTISFYSLLNDE